jgi:hypothetical protein
MSDGADRRRAVASDAGDGSPDHADEPGIGCGRDDPGAAGSGTV